VPWKQELVTNPPRIEDGPIYLPTGPGWGAEIDEQVLRAHAWRPAPGGHGGSFGDRY
jgi:L-alanine-DL-glutamate epimerase-like enolase superfamily enzyme